MSAVKAYGPLAQRQAAQRVLQSQWLIPRRVVCAFDPGSGSTGLGRTAFIVDRK